MSHNTVTPQTISAVNRFEIEKPFFTVLGSIRGKQIVDIGCGDGRYSRKMRHHGASVLGIDLNQNAIAIAKACQDNNLHFHVADAATLTIDPPVDIVTAMMMLNELPKDTFERVFHNVSQWLKAHGRFVFILPHPFNYHERTAVTERIGLAEEDYFHDGRKFTTKYYDKDRLVTVTDHHYSLGYLSQQLTQNGFSITQIVEPQMPDSKEKQYVKYPLYLIIDAVLHTKK
jgi:2-polyprenyl-3-methyl-5-hydroxy-6-metoxy-1,4-benzoquinol methylase